MKDARTTLIDVIKTRLAQHALPLCETHARLYYQHWEDEDEELAFSSPKGYREYGFRAEIQRFYVWCGFKISYPDAIQVNLPIDARKAYYTATYTVHFTPVVQEQLRQRGFAYKDTYYRWEKRYRLPSPPAGVVDVVVADILWLAQLPVTVRSDAD